MRFHDFHLAGYTVSDYGGTILLELVYDDVDQPRETSRMKFSDVAAYHFIHTGGIGVLPRLRPKPTVIPYSVLGAFMILQGVTLGVFHARF